MSMTCRVRRSFFFFFFCSRTFYVPLNTVAHSTRIDRFFHSFTSFRTTHHVHPQRTEAASTRPPRGTSPSRIVPGRQRRCSLFARLQGLSLLFRAVRLGKHHVGAVFARCSLQQVVCKAHPLRQSSPQQSSSKWAIPRGRILADPSKDCTMGAVALGLRKPDPTSIDIHRALYHDRFHHVQESHQRCV